MCLLFDPRWTQNGHFFIAEIGEKSAVLVGVRVEWLSSGVALGIVNIDECSFVYFSKSQSSTRIILGELGGKDLLLGGNVELHIAIMAISAHKFVPHNKTILSGSTSFDQFLALVDNPVWEFNLLPWQYEGAPGLSLLLLRMRLVVKG